jgi:hypothetical protein
MTYDASNKHVHPLKHINRLIQLTIQLLLQLCIHLLLHKMQKLLGFTLLAEDDDLFGSLIAKMSALSPAPGRAAQAKELRSVPGPPSGSDDNMSEYDCSHTVQTVHLERTVQTVYRQRKGGSDVGDRPSQPCGV